MKLPIFKNSPVVVEKSGTKSVTFCTTKMSQSRWGNQLLTYPGRFLGSKVVHIMHSKKVQNAHYLLFLAKKMHSKCRAAPKCTFFKRQQIAVKFCFPRPISSNRGYWVVPKNQPQPIRFSALLAKKCHF